ncbi:transglutaminase-like domain-containing protein [Teredinibacter purpureus]|uniref:transglutaminase-like domain-containing protein n=1 Tax=Teredinibacter purpureus TaxID=2731756 RepID=UPI0006981E53|nr:transglutaminase-like domain-containing protein [Teredinibacter purpureus]
MLFWLRWLCLGIGVGLTSVYAWGEGARSVLPEQWQSISLAGEKVGSRTIRRSIKNERIETTEVLTLHTRVPGQPAQQSTITLRYVEYLDGQPIAVYKTINSAHATHTMAAVVSERFLVVSHGGERAQAKKYSIPPHFYFPEALRQRLLHSDNQSSIEFNQWSFSALAFEIVRLDIQKFRPSDLALENVEIKNFEANNSGAVNKYPPQWRLTQTVLGEENTASVQGRKKILLADKYFYVQSEWSQSSGDALLVETCDEVCATADVTPLQNVYRQLIRSPFRIPDAALKRTIRYHLNSDSLGQVPNTHEQKVKQLDDGVHVTVCAHCDIGAEPRAGELREAMLSNYWIDSDAESIQLKVRTLLNDERSTLNNDEKMKHLSRFVTRHMKTGKVVYSGYARASQALETGSGDCTEHALLLAALARAAGIPTRIIVGLAYSNDRFYGKTHMFIPHAWVQSWVNGVWKSFDSGMEGFTAGHIALGISNGEQSDFMRINHQLRGLTIVSAAQVSSAP